MMEDEVEQKQCVPVTEDARDNLKSAEVYQYFIRALNRELLLSLAPPVQPKVGSIYLYDLGPDSDKWESLKKKIRLDMQKLYKQVLSICTCHVYTKMYQFQFELRSSYHYFITGVISIDGCT